MVRAPIVTTRGSLRRRFQRRAELVAEVRGVGFGGRVESIRGTTATRARNEEGR